LDDEVETQEDETTAASANANTEEVDASEESEEDEWLTFDDETAAKEAERAEAVNALALKAIEE